MDLRLWRGFGGEGAPIEFCVRLALESTICINQKHKYFAEFSDLHAHDVLVKKTCTIKQDKHRHKGGKSRKDGRDEASPEYGGRVTDAKDFAPVTKKVRSPANGYFCTCPDKRFVCQGLLSHLSRKRNVRSPRKLHLLVQAGQIIFRAFVR